MTGYRHRYAESLDTWADEHGETPPPTGPELDQCGRPDHRAFPIHGECDDCNLEACAMGERIKQRRFEDAHDIADAQYSARYQSDYPHD